MADTDTNIDNNLVSENISTNPFIPESENSSWKEYKKYFKILELDSDCDIKQALHNYMNLKSLFTSSVQTAMYSIDSMSSSTKELDEAYEKVKEFLDTKKNNSNFQEPSSSSYFTKEYINTADPFNPEILNENNDINNNNYENNENNGNSLNNENIENNDISSSLQTESEIETSKNSDLVLKPGSSSQEYFSSLKSSANHEKNDKIVADILKESDLGSGATFKKVRTALGLSLEDIQLKTKILTHNLRAIEEENFSDFIALVFLKGFLKAYLKAIRMNDQASYEAYIKKAKLYFDKKR